MPFDTTGFVERELTREERDDLWLLHRSIESLHEPDSWTRLVMEESAGRRRCAVGWLFCHKLASSNPSGTLSIGGMALCRLAECCESLDRMIERRLLPVIPRKYNCMTIPHFTRKATMSLTFFNDAQTNVEPVIAAFQQAANRIISCPYNVDRPDMYSSLSVSNR